LAALLLGALLAGGFLLAQAGRQARGAEEALQAGEDYLRQQKYPEARAAFEHGAALAEAAPFRAELARRLREGARAAERGQAARELHLFADQVRPLYGAELLPEDQARTVEAHCRRLWETRGLIVRRLESSPAPPLESQVRADLVDLAILWADLHVRHAPRGAEGPARREALDLLVEAATEVGPGPILCQARAEHARALGWAKVAAAAAAEGAVLEPRSAWDHYALGRALLRAGDLRRAAEQMERSLARQPDALWPNFYLGRCAYGLGKYDDAVTAFSACVVLAPQGAWCWYNRGLAYLEQGQLDRARRDFDHALDLDPTLAAAALGRSILHYRAQRPREALADLRTALNLNLQTAGVYYQQALAYLALADRPAARASLQRALHKDPGHRLARDLLAGLGPDR
jgi:tetratricopeptide (TPR) repeat protein